MKTREQLAAQIRDIEERRLQAFRDASGMPTKLHLRSMADATNRDDLWTLREAYEVLDEFSAAVASLHADIQREYASGVRCGVCGRTEQQSADINYNCSLEC